MVIPRLLVNFQSRRVMRAQEFRDTTHADGAGVLAGSEHRVARKVIHQVRSDWVREKLVDGGRAAAGLPPW